MTDEGIEGWGEAENSKPYLKPQVLFYRQFVLGEDPTNVERVMRKIRRLGGFKPWGSAVSAIEMALWDIAGKAAGVPVYKLLGGKVRDKVRVYNGGVRFPMTGASPDDYAADVAKMKASPEGFTLIKGLHADQGHELQLLDLSFNVLTAAGGSSATDDQLQILQGGGHDPRQRGFTLQQAELSIAGAVDPYFTGEAHLIYFIDPEGESQFELEEAFATSRMLPFGLHEQGLQVEVGHFFTEFGRINPQHPHQWDWKDLPVINARLFGEDGMRGPGARVGWLLPLPWFSELHLGAQNAKGETMQSFLANDEAVEERPIGGRPFTEPGVRSPADLAYLARWVNGFDLSDTVDRAARRLPRARPERQRPQRRDLRLRRRRRREVAPARRRTRLALRQAASGDHGTQLRRRRVLAVPRRGRLREHRLCASATRRCTTGASTRRRSGASGETGRLGVRVEHANASGDDFDQDTTLETGEASFTRSLAGSATATTARGSRRCSCSTRASSRGCASRRTTTGRRRPSSTTHSRSGRASRSSSAPTRPTRTRRTTA